MKKKKYCRHGKGTMVHIKRLAGFEKVDVNPKFEP